MGNEHLTTAKKNKNDEFYTRYEDIEKELKHYKEYLKDKVVYCNCNDGLDSEFTRYFITNFNELGLKSLIANSYGDNAYSIEINKVFEHCKYKLSDDDISKVLELGENKVTKLKEDGSFSSDECIKLLEKSDVVITNPPFSKFRKLFDVLLKYNKDFLIIAPLSSFTYDVIFGGFKNGEYHCGSTGDRLKVFKIEEDSAYKHKTRDCNGDLLAKMNNCYWLSNIDISLNREELSPTKSYYDEPLNYPEYDNYNAIEVKRLKDIPYDYDGIMGVPITYLPIHNDKQFKIVGTGKKHLHRFNDREIIFEEKYINPKQYRNKEFVTKTNKVNDNPCILVDDPIENKNYYTADNIDGYLIAVYIRIFIKKR